MENEEGPPKSSLTQLFSNIKAQPIPEKLLFFSQVVIVGSSTLPWVRGHAGVGELNAWQLTWLESAAMLVPTMGLAIQLAALSGLRRGDVWAWLAWYRFAYLGLVAVLIYELLNLQMKGFGYWLCVLGLGIQAYAIFPLLRARGLFPFRSPH